MQRRQIVFGLVAVSALTCAMASTVIAVAFNDIMSAFDTSVVAAGWVLTIGQLANGVTMPLTGRITDMIGQKNCFFLSIMLFTVGSILSMVAPNLVLLVIFRFIQGMGVGISLPISSAIIASEFPEQRSKYIGLLTSIFPAGQIFGPNLGGWLTSVYGWRANFWIFIPPGIIILLLSFFALKKSPGKPGTKLDLTGTGLLTAAMSSLMVAISMMGDKTQILWPAVISLFVLTLVFTVIFLVYQRRASNPIIDVQVLREKRFMVSNLFNVIFGVGLLGIISFIPFFAVTVYGMSTLQSGMILTPRSASVMAVSIVTSIWLLRRGYRIPMVTGIIVFVLSLLTLSLELKNISPFGLQISGVVWISVILLIAGAGQGMLAPAANNAAIDLSPDKVASMTGIMGLFRQIGGTISLGVYALILNNLDPGPAFRIIFGSTAILLLLSCPLVFLLPAGARSEVGAGQPAKFL